MAVLCCFLFFDQKELRYGSSTESIPDITIQLRSGNNKNLQDFTDCRRYIYITSWPGKQALIIRELRAFDSIAETYKNKLLIVGLLDNGNVKQLNRLIEKYQLKHLKGVIPEGSMQSLSGKAYPYGMLFSKYGKLIKKEMHKGELEVYMKEHVGVERAKFWKNKIIERKIVSL